MTSNITNPLSQFTDEQLLELSCQRDTLLDKGSAGLDEELKLRGYDPVASPPAIARNYERLFSSYTDQQLHELAKARHTLSVEGVRAFDMEVESRGLIQQDALSSANKLGRAQPGTFAPGVIQSFFLRARSWQLFLLLFGFYVCSSVLQIWGMTPAVVHSWKDIDPLALAGTLLEGLDAILFVAWVWAIGSFATELVHPIARPKTDILNFSSIYAVSYTLLLFISFNLLLSGSTLAFAVLIPLGLVFGFSVFYTMFFASKVLVLAGIFKPGPIFEYVRPLLLIWVYPLGVWIIQPKINRLYRQTTD